MVKLKDLDYINGDIAKENNVKVLHITENPYYIEQENQQGKVEEIAHLTVSIENGSTWLYTPNKTTRRACKAEWGDELDKWKEKDIAIDIKEEKVRKKLKNVIYGKPYKVETEKVE